MASARIPGAYVSHAIAIARTGSTPAYERPDRWTGRASRRVEVTREDPVGRFPAIWIEDRDTQRVVLQFYHLWPALLASAFAAGGYTGLVNLTPLCGVLAVLLVALAARRAFGLLAGALAGLLLATNMLEVWQAKYPSNEIVHPAADRERRAARVSWSPCRRAGGRPAGRGRPAARRCPTWPGRTACC